MSALRTAVFAVGGSVLSRGGRGTQQETLSNARFLASTISKFVSSQRILHPASASHKGSKFGLVLVHGNGPQVGNIVRQQEAVASQIPPFTLDCAVAMTQGSMGYVIEQSLANLNENLNPLTILTQAVIDRKDPALSSVSKAVGRYYPKETAIQLQRDLRWAMQEDPGKGWRQVVASPRPIRVVHSDVVARLLEMGHLVIAAGGGGIPVVKNGDALEGVDAVIDKDFTAAVLADEINAELFVLTTNVDKVCLHYGLKHQQPLHRMTVAETKQYLADGHFLPGTMGAKIEAALYFLKDHPEREVLIATPQAIATGNPEEIGTRISHKK